MLLWKGDEWRNAIEPRQVCCNRRAGREVRFRAGEPRTNGGARLRGLEAVRHTGNHAGAPAYARAVFTSCVARRVAPRAPAGSGLAPFLAAQADLAVDRHVAEGEKDGGDLADAAPEKRREIRTRRE